MLLTKKQRKKERKKEIENNTPSPIGGGVISCYSPRDVHDSSLRNVHPATRGNDGSLAVSLSDVRLDDRHQSSPSWTNSLDVTDMDLLSTTVSPLSSPLSVVSAASEPLDGYNRISMNLSAMYPLLTMIPAGVISL